MVVLAPPRDALYAACDGRFRAMVAAGAVEEARALLALGLDPALPAMKAVGVPELAAHLRGETDLETAIARAQQATRNLAKRQSTWFRNQQPAAAAVDPNARVQRCHVVDAQYSEKITAEIFPFLRLSD